MPSSSDDFVHDFLAATPDCAVILGDDGFLHCHNDRATSAFSIDTEGDQSFADLFNPADRGDLTAAIRAAAEGRRCHVFSTRVLPDGSTTHWQTSVSPWPEAASGAFEVLCVSRDVTPATRSKTDAALAPLFAAAGAIVWTSSADGVLRWTNAHAPTSPMWLDLVHDDDRPSVDKAWMIAAAEGEPIALEARLCATDGAWRWHALRLNQGMIDGEKLWTGVATDIERLKASADLLAADNEQLEQDMFDQLHEVQQSQSRLQAYFDACPDYIYLLRLSNENGLTYEDINPAAEALYDVDRAQIVGRSPKTIDDAATADRIEANVRHCLATGQSVTYQIERRFGPGPSLFVQFVGAPLEYSNEEEGLVLFCGRDMTEQRAVEDALRQSQKMEAVGQLTGGLAHDFNNLLTGITGSLDLLQIRLKQGRLAQVDRYVTGARDAATRAAALTHRLLAFSRRQTLDPKATDVGRLVRGMVDLLERSVGPEISIEVVEGHEALWNVLVDTSQLENTLLNLCINARDAMPDGGTITVETTNIALAKKEADRRDLPPGEYVCLSVTDDGSGMPPDVVARIFDPFFTTKPLGSGTGLGLSMIYGFARQSGGQVRVHSSLGVGTTMRVILPRHLGPSEEADLLPAPANAARARHGETVLVVDDEPTIRMLVAEVLGDLGYGVIEAVDGVTGVALLQSDARIDLLVTDVGLPGGVNGRQVAEAGRKSRPDLKVLFITGYAENAVLNHGHLEAGMQVLTKPFAMDDLTSRIESFFGTD